MPQKKVPAPLAPQRSNTYTPAPLLLGPTNDQYRRQPPAPPSSFTGNPGQWLVDQQYRQSTPTASSYLLDQEPSAAVGGKRQSLIEQAQVAGPLAGKAAIGASMALPFFGVPAATAAAIGGMGFMMNPPQPEPSDWQTHRDSGGFFQTVPSEQGTEKRYSALFGGTEGPHEGPLPEDLLPSFARTKGGGLKLSQNIKKAADEYRRGFYSSNASHTITKELLQNSVDAVKDNPAGKIEVRFHSSDAAAGLPFGGIELVDNGKGMTPDDIYTVFSNLHESGKSEDPDAIGGKGVAKGSFLLNVLRTNVDTTALLDTAIQQREELVRTINNPKLLRKMSEGDQLLYSNKAERQRVADELADMYRWKALGATHVRTHFESTPETLVPDDGSDVSVHLNIEPVTNGQTGTKVRTAMHEKAGGTYYGERFLDEALQYSSGYPDIDVHSYWNDKYGEYNKADMQYRGGQIQKHIGSSLEQSVPQINWANSEDLSTPYAKITAHWTPFSDKPIEAPHGLILNKGAYQMKQQLGAYGEAKQPEHIRFDIDPLVPESHDDYPFTTNREQLPQQLQEHIQEWYKKRIHEPSKTKLTEAIQFQFDKLVPERNRGWIFFDSGERLTPQERREFVDNPAARNLFDNIHQAMLEVHDMFPSKAGRITDKMGIMLSSRDNRGGLTLGINIPNPKDPRWGNRKQPNIIMVNPFGHMEVFSTPDQASAGIWDTILHEIAHNHSRGHEIDFVNALADMVSKIGYRKNTQWMRRLDDALRNPANATAHEFHPDISRLYGLYSDWGGRAVNVPDAISGTGVHRAGPEINAGGKAELYGNAPAGAGNPARQVPIAPPPSSPPRSKK